MPIFAVLAFAAFAFAGPELSDRLQLSDVVGPPEVKVIRAVGKREARVRKGDDLFVGDELDVAEKQIVSIASFDGSSWRLAPGTRFVAEARKPDKQNLSYWLFHLARGALYGKVSKAAPKSGKQGFRLVVRTSTAALGVRGTEFLMSSGDKSSSVDVLEGVVWWGKDVAFADGTFEEVAAGKRSELGADGKFQSAASRGDRTKLLRDYGFELEGTVEKSTPGTAQDCAARGLGWRSRDGSNQGDCFRGNCEGED